MAKWPVRMMVYGGGEAINGSGALAPEIGRQITDLARVCTNRFVAATAQLDASDVPTRRLVLDPGGKQPVLSLPNVNVGDPANLIDFFDWSESICPAERVVLVLSGHGAAWQDSQVNQTLALSGPAAVRSTTAVPEVAGALHHPRSLFGRRINPFESISRAVLIDGHRRDYLSNSELGAVCETIVMHLGRRLDAVVFDACLMSSWEIFHELRESTCTIIASIDELSAKGIPLSGAANKLTALDGKAGPAEIARTFTDVFVPQTDFDSCVAVDLSIPAWKNALDGFQVCCGALLPWVKSDAAHARALQNAMAVASTSLVQYRGGGLADVTSLMSALADLPQAPATGASSAASTASALASCVIGHVAGHDYRHATGLSIFSPTSRTVYLSNRVDYSRLQFPIMTGWLAVLDAVFAAS
jgi:hypothetical protein